MAPFTQQASNEQPASLARYRSTRRAAEIAAQAAASPSPPSASPISNKASQNASPAVQRSMSRYKNPPAAKPVQNATSPETASTKAVRAAAGLNVGTMRNPNRPAKGQSQKNDVQPPVSPISPTIRDSKPAPLKEADKGAMRTKSSQDPIQGGRITSPRPDARPLLEAQAEAENQRKSRVQSQIQNQHISRDQKVRLEAQRIVERQIAENARQDQIKALAQAEFAELQRRTKHKQKMESYRDQQITAMALQPQALQWEEKQKEQQQKIEKDMERRRTKREKERKAREKDKPVGGFSRDREPEAKQEIKTAATEGSQTLVDDTALSRRGTDTTGELKKTSSKEIFGFLKKKKSDLKSSPTIPPPVDEEPLVPPRDFKKYPTLDPKINPPETKKPTPKPPNPPASAQPANIDAPVSSVNAGNRFVSVENGTATLSLAVTPTTTPLDLLTTASTFSPTPLDPQNFVIHESFGKVGVQRPLRAYERIRDVLNSWDFDRQNTLLITPSTTGGSDIELQADYVPIEQPAENSCTLLYSQKPGKWDKRHTTIRSDGQVTIAKNESSAPKDIHTICHLTDFDIYTSSPSSTRSTSKRIKPPKRFCYAIKSQQKSSVFESASLQNFVHFFSTGDRKTAAQFYSAVQGWRSWYLVNVLGMGGGNDPSGRRRVRPGSKDSGYQIGSFKPLLDWDAVATTVSSNSLARRHSHSRSESNSLSQLHGISKHRPQSRGFAPPSSYPKHLTPTTTSPTSTSTSPSSSTNQHSILNRPRALPRTTANPLSHGSDHHNNDATAFTFAPSGLLGRSYTQRQQKPGSGSGDSAGLQKGSREGEGEGGDGGGSPFREEGLLANVKASPSRRQKSRDGLVQGQGQREGPMIDVSFPSRFEKGSLLERVERQRNEAGNLNANANGLVVDRSRGREVLVGTGEI